MQTIKELNQLKDINKNAVNQLFAMLPNYEVAKLFANDLNCDIEQALVVANELIPKIDIYCKRDDKYYHVYKYSVLNHEYTVKVVYLRQLKNSDGNLYDKWYSNIDRVTCYRFDEVETITKEEFEAKEALVE